MEFCKIKPKHILFNDLTHAQIGQLVIIQCLTASLDRLPTDKEICKLMSQTQLKRIKEHCQTHGKPLEDVLQKVLEDVEDVLQTREYFKIKKREYRKKLAMSKGTVQDGLAADKNKNKNKNKIIHIGHKAPVFEIPKSDQVYAYCLERNNNVDPDTFINFYSSKGWMIGKNKMKDWKAAIRTWEKSNNRTVNNNAPSSKAERSKENARKYIESLSVEAPF
jgi:hypothetical protein